MVGVWENNGVENLSYNEEQPLSSEALNDMERYEMLTIAHLATLSSKAPRDRE